MLDEGVQIMRQAWTEGRATLDGKHYQVDGAIVRPLPLQEGGIPLWIAGGGEKVTLKIAAKYAQYTNFDGTLEVFARKSELLEGHCDDGRHRLRRDRPVGQLQRRHRRDRGRGAEAAGRAPGPLGALRRGPSRPRRRAAHLNGAAAGGTPEQIVEKLGELRERGLSYGIFYFPEAAYDRSGIELFEREVIPALS